MNLTRGRPSARPHRFIGASFTSCFPMKYRIHIVTPAVYIVVAWFICGLKFYLVHYRPHRAILVISRYSEARRETTEFVLRWQLTRCSGPFIRRTLILIGPPGGMFCQIHICTSELITFLYLPALPTSLILARGV